MMPRSFNLSFFLVLGLSIGCSSVEPNNHQPLTFVFPEVHYKSNWDISDGRSLWKLLLVGNIAEPPIRLDHSYNFKKGLFSAWEFSQDRKVFKAKIDKTSYRFHSGDPVRSIDVYNSILRTLADRRAAHSDLYKVLCQKSPRCPGIQLENDTLVFKFKKAQNAFLRALSVPEFGIVPGDYPLGRGDKKKFLKNLSGPYRVVSFSERLLELKAHAHPLISTDAPREVRVKQIPSSKERVRYYKENKNVVLFGLNYKTAKDLLELPGKKFFSSPLIAEFILPNVFDSKMKSVHDRKKLFSILRKVKSELRFDKRVVKLTDQLFHTSNLASLSGDLDSYFQENPTPYEKPLALEIMVFDQLGESPFPHQLKVGLKKYNIDLKVVYPDTKTLLERIKGKNFDLVYLFGGIGVQDPLIEYNYIYTRGIRGPFLTNPKAKSLLSRAQVETDREEYVRIMKALHKDMLFSYRLFPVVHVNIVFLTNSVYKLYSDEGNMGHNFWQWHLKN